MVTSPLTDRPGSNNGVKSARLTTRPAAVQRGWWYRSEQGEGTEETFSLTLAAGRYSIFVAPDLGVPEVGDQGAYDYHEHAPDRPGRPSQS